MAENALTTDQLEQAYQYFMQKGVSLASLQDGDDNLHNKYLAPVMEYNPGGTSAKLVRMAVALLAAKQVSLRKGANGQVEWRREGEEWEPLFELAEIKGDSGQSPVFRSDSEGIQWKYEDEAEDAWRELIEIDLLRLTYDKLTPEQKEEVKLKFSDLSPDDILFLQKPAKDATEAASNAAQEAFDITLIAEETEKARKAAETERVKSENTRMLNEQGRITAEDARLVDEALRKSAENVRIENENIRIAQEEVREEATVQALINVEGATNRLNAFSDHRDEIRDGFWWRWDEITGEWYDTGERANGDVLLPAFEISVDGDLIMTKPAELTQIDFALEGENLVMTIND